MPEKKRAYSYDVWVPSTIQHKQDVHVRHDAASTYLYGAPEYFRSGVLPPSHSPRPKHHDLLLQKGVWSLQVRPQAGLGRRHGCLARRFNNLRRRGSLLVLLRRGGHTTTQHDVRAKTAGHAGKQLRHRHRRRGRGQRRCHCCRLFLLRQRLSPLVEDRGKRRGGRADDILLLVVLMLLLLL